MGFLAKLFGKEKKQPSVKEVVAELKTGSPVHLKIKDPYKMGVVQDGKPGLTRLNEAELHNLEFEGMVTAIRKMPEPLLATVLEITTHDSPAVGPQPRKYAFLLDEIEEIRKLK